MTDRVAKLREELRALRARIGLPPYRPKCRSCYGTGRKFIGYEFHNEDMGPCPDCDGTGYESS